MSHLGTKIISKKKLNVPENVRGLTPATRRLTLSGDGHQVVDAAGVEPGGGGVLLGAWQRVSVHSGRRPLLPGRLRLTATAGRDRTVVWRLRHVIPDIKDVKQR